MFTANQKKIAQSLAVSYQAFHEAMNKADSNGVRVWGEVLLEAQVKTGIVLNSPDVIKGIMMDGFPE